MKILITCCPRSGSMFTSRILKSCGKEILHEEEGKDGIVSWFLAPTIPEGSTCHQFRNFKLIRTKGKSHSLRRPYHLNRPVPTYEFKLDYKQIHQIRHPQKCISSMESLKDLSFLWTNGFIEYPYNYKQEQDMTKSERQEYSIVKRMYFWYFWNKIGIENSKWHYTIESLEDVKERFCEECQITTTNFDKACKETSKDVNKRNKPISISWEKMRSVDEKMFEKILVLAESLGYSCI